MGNKIVEDYLSNCCNAPVEDKSFGHVGTESVCTKCDAIVTWDMHKTKESYTKSKPRKPDNAGDIVYISYVCSICARGQTEPGALLFSPPVGLNDYVSKHHICRSCYGKILKL